jgi:hypothetical protein
METNKITRKLLEQPAGRNNPASRQIAPLKTF